MLRVRYRQKRRPRLHEIRGSASHAVGARGRVKEDWSFRSSSRREVFERQGIYVFHAVGTDFYKIGVTVDPETRRRELQCGIPFVLELVYFFCPAGNAQRIEAAAHAKAREEKRAAPADNEFFRFASRDEARDFVKKLVGD